VDLLLDPLLLLAAAAAAAAARPSVVSWYLRHENRNKLGQATT
jgi:hypothetical protein